VRIIFQISEKKINRRFTQVPVELEGGSPNHDFHLKPNTVGVLLQAPVSVLERIQEGHELRARVEVSGLSMGRHEVKILVKAPHLAHVIEITPEYAVLEIVDHKEVE
jgi:YbbR domain-containing protein